MSSGEIKVVKYRGEKLFKSQDNIMLDILYGFDFYTGKISIIRRGVEVDHCTIEADGKRDPSPCFEGLEKLLKNFQVSGDRQELYPAYFEEGDKIRFENARWDLDFKEEFIEDDVANKLSHILQESLKILTTVTQERVLNRYDRLLKKEREKLLANFPNFPIHRRILKKNESIDLGFSNK
ncbi:MAG: hypothetical protein Q7S19_03315 [bacterium]|nr:hypothetical protein [bacterium]